MPRELFRGLLNANGVSSELGNLYAPYNSPRNEAQVPRLKHN